MGVGYKHTDKAYLRHMLQEQLFLGLIDEIDWLKAES